jgi:PAS domain S-box-containing protein
MPKMLNFRLKLAGQRRLSFSTSIRAALTFAVGIAITIALSLWMHTREQELEDYHFELGASAYIAAIRERLTDAVQALELVNQSFKTFAPVSRDQFHVFIEPILERSPYIQSFSLHRLVSKDGRAAFEAEMRKHHPDFVVSDLAKGKRLPAPVRESYRVVTYVEPMAGNEAVFGLDVAALTRSQDDAIRRAGATGKASASRLFPLPQKNDAQAFAIVMPVYQRSDWTPGKESRLDDIAGYTLAIFRATDFIEGILKAADLLTVPANISVYIGELSMTGEPIYQKTAFPSAAAAGRPMRERVLRDMPQALARTLDVAGAPWHIAISAPPTPFIKHHLGSLLALFGGVLVSFLAAGSMQKLALRSHRTQQLVNRRTAELQVVNQRLTNDIAARKETEQRLRHTQLILMNAQKIAHLGSWVFNPKTHDLQCSDEFFRICGLKPQSIEPSLEFALGIVHPEDADAAHKAVAATLTEGKEYRIEKRIIRPDGSTRYIASRGELIDEHLFVGSYLDVTEQKQTEIALRESREKLRELAAHLERIREEERKRIAREIHDELGALLTGIKAHLSVAIDTAGNQASPLLTEAAQLADVATNAVRRVVTDLRPSVLDQLGVWDALEWYAGGIEQRTRLTCECAIDAHVATIELGPERSAMVFRVVQEALTNVVRHADATRVTVRALREEHSVVVEVEDDGIGFATERLAGSKSWGIVGMHERARYFGGELTISGSAGSGTTVALRLPLEGFA